MCIRDSICNTLGGIAGYMVTPLLVFLLPDRNKIDEIAYKKGQIVSEFRRGIAWCIDIFIVMLLSLIHIFNTFVEDVKSLFNDNLHKLLLTLPVGGVLIFTILPLVFMISMAFTNYRDVYKRQAKSCGIVHGYVLYEKSVL